MNLRGIFLIIIGVLLHPAVSLWAQQDVLRFHDVSVADALTSINEHYPDNSIHFVRNELDTLRIATLTVKGQDVLDDITHIIGKYPIGLKIFGNHIFVEYKRQKPLFGNIPQMMMHEEEDIAFSRILHEVMVSQTLPFFDMNGAMMSLRITDTPLTLAGSAFDLLYYLPDVNLGAPGTVIRIDGKTVTNYSELAELGSEEVDRIDYSDSPQYSSRQNTIIDIRTHRQREDGYGIHMASQFSQGDRGRAMQLVKTNVHHGRWDMQASGTYRYDAISKDLVINDYTLQDRYEQNSFHLNCGGEGRIAQNFTLGLQYQLFTMVDPIRQERDFFSVNFDPSNLAGFGNAHFLLSSKPGVRNWQLDNRPQHDANLYLKTRLGAWDMNAETSFYHDGIEISEDTQIMDEEPDHRSNVIENTLWSVRADAGRPLWNGRLQLMGEYAYTGREDKYFRYDLSDALLRERKRWSGSISYRKQIGKIEGLLGLLCETIDVAPDLQKLYPFASYSYLDNKQKVMLSYARRSSLPTYGQTNNYAFHNVEILSVKGEPSLKPSVIDQLQLKFMRGGFYGALSWQHVNDFVAQSIEMTNGYQYCSSYRNIDHANLYSATLNYHHSYQSWTSQYTASMRGQRLQSWNMQFNKPIFELSWNNQIQFPHGFTAMVNASYHTSGNEGTSWQKQTGQIGASLIKEAKNWTLQLRADDLLRTGATHTIYYGKDSEYSRRCYDDTQRIMLTLRINLWSLFQRHIPTL